jgi:hypothetical protein
MSQQQQASTSLGLPTGMDSLPSDILFDEAKSEFGKKKYRICKVARML